METNWPDQLHRLAAHVETRAGREYRQDKPVTSAELFAAATLMRTLGEAVEMRLEWVKNPDAVEAFFNIYWVAIKRVHGNPADDRQMAVDIADWVSNSR